MASKLPDFKSPPLTEVALSVQFEPIAEMHVPQLGLLWDRYKKQFPSVEEHQPLNPTIEMLGLKVPLQPPQQIKMVQNPVIPRCWFLNKDGSQLIQVQQDRFVHNWRKTSSSDQYPRYDSVKGVFKRELTKFQDFLKENSLGELIPNQCEVTYVNHIFPCEVWGSHSELNKVIKLVQPVNALSSLIPETSAIDTKYIIRNEDDDFLGRLHINVIPAFKREDDSPIFAMNLVARGKPIGDGIPGIMSFLDLGRENIVRMFAEVTTTKMHKIWGRLDNV